MLGTGTRAAVAVAEGLARLARGSIRRLVRCLGVQDFNNPPVYLTYLQTRREADTICLFARDCGLMMHYAEDLGTLGCQTDSPRSEAIYWTVSAWQGYFVAVIRL